MSLMNETIGILDRLIAFPTVSSDSNLELIVYASELLEHHGFRTTVSRDVTGKKANLFASLGPDAPDGIVLSGHTDVVPADAADWTSDPFRLRQEGDLLFGRGTCDMKGFIATVLAMAPHYAELNLQRPLHVALTYDEETGCFGARHLVEELKTQDIRPSVAIIGEPTSMRVIEGHKGCYEYTTCFHGTDGHGSEPDKGVNAIHYAVRFMTRLMELGETVKAGAKFSNERYQPPWTTVQVGRIEGGKARNVIARNCSVEWEMRPVQQTDATLIKEALEEYCRTQLLPEMQAVSSDARIVTEIIGEVAGLEVMSDNEARDIVCKLTGSDLCDVVAFGTEAGLFQSLGMSVVVCGPGSIAQAHQPDEYVSVGQLQSSLDMLSGLSATLEQRP